MIKLAFYVYDHEMPNKEVIIIRNHNPFTREAVSIGSLMIKESIRYHFSFSFFISYSADFCEEVAGNKRQIVKGNPVY